MTDRQRKLVEQLSGLGPVLRVSLIERFTQCGRAGCKCMQGEKHGPNCAASKANRRQPRRREQRRRLREEDRRKRRAGRAFEPAQAPTIERVLLLLTTTALELGRWLSLGLALLTVVMLRLWRGARSGNGWLTLCALSHRHRS